MDLNLVTPQIPASAPAPDGPSNVSPMAKPASSTDARDSFSSALRSAHQENRNSSQAQKREEPQSSAANHADARDTQTKHANHRSSESHDSQDRSSDASSDATQDVKKTDSSDSTQDEHDAQPNQIGTDATTQGMVVALLQTPTVTPGAPPQNMTAAQSLSGEPSQAHMGLLPTAEGQHTTPGIVLPAVAAAPSANPATMPPVIAASAATTTGQSSTTQQKQQPASQQVLIDGAPTPSLDPSQIQQNEPSKTPDQNESDRQKAAPPVVAKEAASPQPPVLTAQPGQSPNDRGREDAAAGLVNTPADAGVQQTTEKRDQQPLASQTPPSSRDGLPKEEATLKNAPAQPHSWDAFDHADKPSDMSWSDRQESRHDHADTALPQGAAAPALNTQAATAAQTETTFAFGNAAQPTPRSMDARSAPTVSQPQPLTAAHDVSDAPMPAMSRSVVFEVAQPDLGRVNVRVAMTNNLVHTHLSSDRPDVGQYLMNGQDRLQAALQASGLDMGQFRVHVDRQGTQHGGQEWLSRGYDDRSQQQQGNHRQQNRTPASLPNGSHRAGMLSLFA